jgi:hypothetical protein
MTAQAPEILVHRGVQLNLCADPLYEYLEQLPHRHHPEFASTSTACHRGYVGTWEIRGGHLVLVALEGLIKTADGFVEADLKTAFPWVNDTLRASWVTNRLRCPEGRLVSYVHQGYASRYERDRVFDFEEGRLVAEWLILNPPEPIVYRIDEHGHRVCVEGMCAWAEETVPDPLGSEDFREVYKVWGRPPAAEQDEGYLLGGEYRHPPR